MIRVHEVHRGPRPAALVLALSVLFGGLGGALPGPVRPAAASTLLQAEPAEAEAAGAEPAVQAEPVAPPAPVGPAPSPGVPITLAALGFGADLLLSDGRPEALLRFPLPDGGIAGGTLRLVLVPAPGLADDAAVSVSLGEPPAATTVATTAGTLRRDGGALSLPLAAARTSPLPVRVALAPAGGAAACDAAPPGGRWLQVRRESGLAYQPGDQPATVEAFLRRTGGTVLVRGRWDTPAAQQASVDLFSALEYVLRDRAVQVLLAEDAAPAALATGTALPGDDTALAWGLAGQRVVTLGAAAAGAPPLALDGDSLTVAPTDAALAELLARAGMATPPPGASRDRAGPVGAGYRIDLSRLQAIHQWRGGVPDRPATAGGGSTGVAPVTARFTVADLHGWPADLALNLEAVADPLPAGAPGRPMAQVRLNGTLLETVEAGAGGVARRTVGLPPALLGPENVLEVAFARRAPEGACGPAAPGAGGAPPAGLPHGGRLAAGSALTWSRFGEARGLLPELIGTLPPGADTAALAAPRTGTAPVATATGAAAAPAVRRGELLLLGGSPAEARAAARLLGALSRESSSPLLPVLAPAGDAARAPAGAYRIVFAARPVPPGAGRPRLPVDVAAGVEVLDPDRRRVLLRSEPSRPLVAVQYLPGTAPTVVVTTSPGAGGPDAAAALLDTVFARATRPSRFLGVGGNVLLAGPDEDLLAVDLRRSGLHARPAGTADGAAGWWPLRGGLAVGLTVVVLGGWFAAYRRVGRRPPAPPPVASAAGPAGPAGGNG